MFQPLLPLDRLRVAAPRVHRRRCSARGIGTGVHYEACTSSRCIRALGLSATATLPNAERIGRATVTLPLFPAMTDADVERVCDAVRDVLRRAWRP